MKKQVREIESSTFGVSFPTLFCHLYIEKDFEESERRREKWEWDNNPDGEKEEMYELFEKKGLSPKLSRKVIDIFAKDANLFLEVMMVEELGIKPTDPDEAAWKNGLVTFFSFIAFGFVPLLVWIIGGASAGLSTASRFQDTNTVIVFVVCCVVSLLTMFSLGAITSKFSHQTWWKSGLSIMLNGGVCAAISFGVGYGLDQAVQ